MSLFEAAKKFYRVGPCQAAISDCKVSFDDVDADVGGDEFEWGNNVLSKLLLLFRRRKVNCDVTEVDVDDDDDDDDDDDESELHDFHFGCLGMTGSGII